MPGSPISFVVLITVLLQLKEVEGVIPGGLTEERKVDPKDPTGQHVIQITEEVWGAAEKMAGKKFDKFIAVSYRSQVVAGVNYFIKVFVGDSNYVHICVYNHLSGQVQLKGVETGKKLNDPIERCSI